MAQLRGGAHVRRGEGGVERLDSRKVVWQRIGNKPGNRFWARKSHEADFSPDEQRAHWKTTSLTNGV